MARCAVGPEALDTTSGDMDGSRKWCWGKGTMFMVMSLRSTLSVPSKRMPLVKLRMTLAAMLFILSYGFLPAVNFSREQPHFTSNVVNVNVTNSHNVTKFASEQLRARAC